MIAKFNKETERWGVWSPMYELWMCTDFDKPLRFQSKQEAQRFIERIK